MAQDAVEGTDLKALLERDGALDTGRAVALLSQLADALDAVHDAGLIHRDVKPANVLIAPGPGGDHVFLTDFGLGKDPNRDSRALTAPGEVVGTQSYTAPEQVLGKPVGPAADIYALGCVLYECLTGEPPFGHNTFVELLEAHVESPPPMVSERRPDLSPAIDAVVARALAKAPAERYGRASELMAAARDALGVAAEPAVEPPAELRLVATAGNALGTEIRVGDGFEIGRQESGQGSLAGDPELSRRHARFRRGPGGYVIEDLNSTNGTYVNGRRIEGAHQLTPGDTIEVGSTMLRVDGAPAGPVDEAPRPTSAPAAPGRADLSLRIDVDFGAREATLSLADNADPIRLVHEDGRWRVDGRKTDPGG
jgi:hypothetical protein